MSDSGLLSEAFLTEDEQAKRVKQARESLDMILGRLMVDMLSATQELETIEECEWAVIK